jgi:hypothetical protein
MHKDTNFDCETQGYCRGWTWEVDSDLMKNKQLKTQ